MATHFEEELSAEDIIRERRASLMESGDVIDGRNVGLVCGCCSKYAVARTPVDHRYRGMQAWLNGDVAAACGCPYVDGLSDGGERLLVKANLDLPKTCQSFELDLGRLPSEIAERCALIDRGECEGDGLDDDVFLKDVGAVDARIAKASSDIADMGRRVQELISDKRELESERDYLFLQRYEVNGVPKSFARLMGALAGSEHEEALKNAGRLSKAGYDIRKTYVVQVTPSSRTLDSAVAKGVIKYRDLYESSVSILARPVSCGRRGGRLMVKLVETRKNFAERMPTEYRYLLGEQRVVVWRDAE